MSLATELVKPSISTVFLVEHSAALWLRAWVLTASQAVTYEIPLSHHGIAAQQDITVTGVKEAGTALTSQTSIANVESNPGSFFYDSANLKIHVSAATVAADRGGLRRPGSDRRRNACLYQQRRVF